MTNASDVPASVITYAGYLALDDLLAAQHPLSDEHDEMLFVIIHQTKELWLKQILHEVAQAQAQVRAGDLVPAYKGLARVSRIQAVMTMSWDILATMTPADYLRFRGSLGTSSGTTTRERHGATGSRPGMRRPACRRCRSSCR